MSSNQQQQKQKQQQQQQQQEQQQQEQVLFLAKATNNYSKIKPDDVELQKGDIVEVLKTEFDSWWVGNNTRTGELGWFPSNYVRKVDSSKTIKRPKKKTRMAEVLFDYNSGDADDLQLKQGERVEILEEYDEWYLGRNGASFGTFPSEYVKILSSQEIQEHEESENKEKEKGKEATMINVGGDKVEGSVKSSSKAGGASKLGRFFTGRKNKEKERGKEKEKEKEKEERKEERKNSIEEGKDTSRQSIDRAMAGPRVASSGATKGFAVQREESTREQVVPMSLPPLPPIPPPPPPRSPQSSQSPHLSSAIYLSPPPKLPPLPARPISISPQAMNTSFMTTENENENENKDEDVSRNDNESENKNKSRLGGDIDALPPLPPVPPLPRRAATDITRSSDQKVPKLQQLEYQQQEHIGENDLVPPPLPQKREYKQVSPQEPDVIAQDEDNELEQEEKTEEKQQQKQQKQKQHQHHHQQQQQAQILEDYETDLPEELYLNAGDYVTVIHMGTKNDDRWKGDYHGRIGLFPAHIVQLIDDDNDDDDDNTENNNKKEEGEEQEQEQEEGEGEKEQGEEEEQEKEGDQEQVQKQVQKQKQKPAGMYGIKQQAVGGLFSGADGLAALQKLKLRSKTTTFSDKEKSIKDESDTENKPQTETNSEPNPNPNPNPNPQQPKPTSLESTPSSSFVEKDQPNTSGTDVPPQVSKPLPFRHRNTHPHVSSVASLEKESVQDNVSDELAAKLARRYNASEVKPTTPDDSSASNASRFSVAKERTSDKKNVAKYSSETSDELASKLARRFTMSQNPSQNKKSTEQINENERENEQEKVQEKEQEKEHEETTVSLPPPDHQDHQDHQESEKSNIPEPQTTAPTAPTAEAYAPLGIQLDAESAPPTQLSQEDKKEPEHPASASASASASVSVSASPSLPLSPVFSETKSPTIRPPKKFIKRQTRKPPTSGAIAQGAAAESSQSKTLEKSLETSSPDLTASQLPPNTSAVPSRPEKPKGLVANRANIFADAGIPRTSGGANTLASQRIAELQKRLGAGVAATIAKTGYGASASASASASPSPSPNIGGSLNTSGDSGMVGLNSELEHFQTQINAKLADFQTKLDQLALSHQPSETAISGAKVNEGSGEPLQTQRLDQLQADLQSTSADLSNTKSHLALQFAKDLGAVQQTLESKLNDIESKIQNQPTDTKEIETKISAIVDGKLGGINKQTQEIKNQVAKSETVNRELLDKLGAKIHEMDERLVACTNSSGKLEEELKKMFRTEFSGELAKINTRIDALNEQVLSLASSKKNNAVGSGSGDANEKVFSQQQQQIDELKGQISKLLSKDTNNDRFVKLESENKKLYSMINDLRAYIDELTVDEE